MSPKVQCRRAVVQVISRTPLVPNSEKVSTLAPVVQPPHVDLPTQMNHGRLVAHCGPEQRRSVKGVEEFRIECRHRRLLSGTPRARAHREYRCAL